MDARSGIDGGEVLWKAQERSSVEDMEDPKGDIMANIEPHLRQSVSVGEAKVGVVPSGMILERGV